MEPYYEAERVTLYHGDCGLILPTLPGESVDAVITDPPAGIEFMGKEWDGSRGGRAGWIDWLAGICTEVQRVMKPGAHGLVWALPRTSHWTATAMDEAGFEIRDCLTHLFGTGFPKSLNLQGDWQGYGTALKPASEHWWLVRKPLSESSVAANVQRWRTGALNIDGCRLESGPSPSVTRRAASAQSGQTPTRPGEYGHTIVNRTSPERYVAPRAGEELGRWPPNVALSHDETCEEESCTPGCPVRLLDEQSGERASGQAASGGHYRSQPSGQRIYGSGRGLSMEAGPAGHLYGDSGGASRFFYVAKPTRKERDAGLESAPPRMRHRVNPGGLERDPKWAPVTAKNHHPTVKSLALMRWLCRLITPPGGLVLDPFAGSGTTGLAALSEGCHFLGIEQDAEYVEIARGRLQQPLAVSLPLF